MHFCILKSQVHFHFNRESFFWQIKVFVSRWHKVMLFLRESFSTRCLNSHEYFLHESSDRPVFVLTSFAWLSEFLVTHCLLQCRKRHLSGTPSCSKQMLKAQPDLGLVRIWFLAALESHQVSESLSISFLEMVSSGVLHKADGHEHVVGTMLRSSGKTAWHWA